MSKTIALLSDFGTTDIYVGVMKGVMRQIAPNADLIDITHAISPQSVRGGAIALKNAVPYFPEQTVFLVVVDPGVGSRRRPIAVQTGMHIFVAPDNGILSYVLEDSPSYTAVELTNPAYQRATVSRTFHGRDIFAPAAAYLARGDVNLRDMGQTLHELAQLPAPALHITPDSIMGEITHIDHFGNIITNIGPLRWVDDKRLILKSGEATARLMAANTNIQLHTAEILGMQHTYSDVMRGTLLAQVDSNGNLEIAINQGSAAQRLDAAIGDTVTLSHVAGDNDT